MKNKYLKVLLVFLVLIIIEFFCNQLYVFADTPGKGQVSESTQSLIDDMDLKNQNNDAVGNSSLVKVTAQIFSVIQFIGTGISIIMIMWVGMSYMMSSVEQKAELKKRLVPIVIGSVFIVATANILKFIQVIITSSLK